MGLLRALGLLNAAVWFGAAVFYNLSLVRVPLSAGMQALLGPKNFPYFSGAIGNLLLGSYLRLQIICSLVALAHLGTEWVYLGKKPGRARIFLLVCICGLTNLESLWLLPRLERLLTSAYAVNLGQSARAAAAHHLSGWLAATQALNFLIAFCLGVYLWKMTHPPDPARFVSAAKFRS
jgi:hypothetical protein